MLESVERDNKTISEAYKGDELVWKLPTIMMADVNLRSGFKTIILNTYPGRCNVVITINKKEVANGLSSPSGVFSVSVDPVLQKGDFVVIELTKSGWGNLENYYSIY